MHGTARSAGLHVAVGVLVVGVLAGGLLALQQQVFGRGTAGAAGVAAPVAVPAAVPDRAPVSRGGARAAAGVPLVDAAWAERTAAAAGIPVPALLAYARASLQAPAGCAVGWVTLAGIGWVESHHGTIGDRAVQPDGRSSTPILGPALDGVGPVAAIRATPDSTAWHGDPRWDHAVGPLQFLPSSWERWGADGDGDGATDPHDLDDAALAAARYLCADGHDLTTGAGWAAAVFSYNHATEYVEAVRTAALAYAGRAGSPH